MSASRHHCLLPDIIVCFQTPLSEDLTQDHSGLYLLWTFNSQETIVLEHFDLCAALSNLAGQTICDAMYVQLDAKLYNRVHKLHEFLYMQFYVRRTAMVYDRLLTRMRAESAQTRTLLSELFVDLSPQLERRAGLELAEEFEAERSKLAYEVRERLATEFLPIINRISVVNIGLTRRPK